MVTVVAATTLIAGAAFGAACGDDPAPAVPDDAGAPPAIPKPDTDNPTILSGWRAVLRRDCARCHEPPDANDGILSGGVAPVPGTQTWATNLTPDPDTGLDAWDAAAIAQALRGGTDDQGEELCPTMPRFADMNDEEAAAIAAYLQNLAAVHHYVPESICPPLKVPGADVAGADADTGVDDAASDAGASDAPTEG